MTTVGSQKHAVQAIDASPFASANTLRIKVIDTEAALNSFGSRWEALQKDAARTSIAETFDWQRLWWESYGRGQPLRLITASDGDKVVGILPVYVQTQVMLHYPVRLLRFLGSGGDTYPDDLGPIMALGREEEVAKALADAALSLAGWDVLLLADMNPACAFTQAIAAAARAARLETQTGRSESIAYIALPATWDEWLQSLHRDRRYKVRIARKKLHAAHPTRFFVWDDPATLDQGIDRLIYLHHKRWNSIGQSHAFSSEQYLGFHRAVMKACLQQNRLRLYALEVSGQVVAMVYAYKFRDTVYSMQNGFDPDFSEVKPGQVLLGHIIEHVIGEGHKVLDFMRGDHRYKAELATGDRETTFVTAFRPTLGAWAYRTRRVHLPRIKARVLETLRRVRPASPSV
jgi:CelD/BcsL family acetyltransferase involved in cellulose biosynthesis